MAGTTTERRRFEMSTKIRKLFLLLAAVGVLFVATGITAPAEAGPPPSDKISISASSKTCTVSTTYQWKGFDAASSVQLNLFRNGVPVDSVVGSGSTGELTTSFTDDVGGAEYYAWGLVSTNGPIVDQSYSRVLTLRCR
jgi:hypothetical protein